MAALAADAPQTYAAFMAEHDEPLLLVDTIVYTGSLLVNHATTVDASKRKASETAGFTGIALGPGLTGEVQTVRVQGFWIGSLNVTIAAADRGAIVYSPAATDNPVDSTTVITGAMPWGRIHRVLTAGAAGVNRVVVYFQCDSMRSLA